MYILAALYAVALLLVEHHQLDPRDITMYVNRYDVVFF